MYPNLEWTLNISPKLENHTTLINIESFYFKLIEFTKVFGFKPMEYLKKSTHGWILVIICLHIEPHLFHCYLKEDIVYHASIFMW